MKKLIKTIALVAIGVAVGRVSKSVHHYQTKYTENDERIVESWIQIELLGKSYCISKKHLYI